eukprot:scpid106103/ scgid35440/ 
MPALCTQYLHHCPSSELLLTSSLPLAFVVVANKPLCFSCRTFSAGNCTEVLPTVIVFEGGSNHSCHLLPSFILSTVNMASSCGETLNVALGLQSHQTILGILLVLLNDLKVERVNGGHMRLKLSSYGHRR